MTDARLENLVLTLTAPQRTEYHEALKGVRQELEADMKHFYVLRDAHKLYVLERVLTNRPVNIADAVRSVTPNPYGQ